MKQKITQKLSIPEGIVCTYTDENLVCKKDSAEVSRKIAIPQVTLTIKENELILNCPKGNKNQFKIIMTNLAHIRNLFRGLNEKFTYKLEAVNVHFPMKLKAQGSTLTITNFLGEKVPRTAKILPNVDVDIEGQNITISSHNRESAGQTAANFEKAAKLKGKDRRIFQDGIYITEKPGRAK